MSWSRFLTQRRKRNDGDIMKVILLSGKAGSGKDTAGEMLRKILWGEGYRVLLTHFADPLKFMLSNAFNWNGVKDDYGRHMLQNIGTDVVRMRYDQDYWVRYVDDVIKIGQLSGINRFDWDCAIVPDLRFTTELLYLQDCGYDVIHVRINRDIESHLSPEQLLHVSENDLNDVEPDVVIDNNGTPVQLYANLFNFAKQENMIEGV